MKLILSVLLTILYAATQTHGLAATGSGRTFVFSPKKGEKPRLVLISGTAGTGKSTFGMSAALDQGILKCVSTDTVRAVMRSNVPKSLAPALHRSSYGLAHEADDPVQSWIETCEVLEDSVEGLIGDAIRRGTGLVLEGVSIAPANKWIQMWEEAGGAATGVVLTVPDENTHRELLMRRGSLPEKTSEAAFERIRIIQNEIFRRGKEAGWLIVEQKIEPDPLETLDARLDGIEEGTVSRRDRQTPNSDESEKTLPTAELHPKNRKGPGSSLERDRYQW